MGVLPEDVIVYMVSCGGDIGEGIDKTGGHDDGTHHSGGNTHYIGIEF